MSHSQLPLAKFHSTQSQIDKSYELVIDSLREAVKSGEMLHDVSQEKVAKRLSNLQKALVGYSNHAVIAQAKETESGEAEARVKDDLSNTESQNKETSMVPRGLFIHGNVGTGKTHLMDLFYQTCPIDPHRKKRVHFHSFLQDVHKRIHDLKQRDLITHGRNFTVDTSQERNPIVRVARQLAEEVSLLCFDEFQVTDVADALILSQLFSVLFRRGTVVVATSNRPPGTLYEGGLNRSYFLPFIDLLCRHCIVHDMDAATDYRIVTTAGSDSLFYVSTCEDSMKEYRQVLDKSWSEDNVQTDVKVNAAFNRTVKVPEVHANGDIARFRFRDLCNTELGSSDYRAIAQQFKAIIIDDIPLLTLKGHDQARRFITLVDELYEADCALMCCAVASPENLFVGRESHDSHPRIALSTSCLKLNVELPPPGGNVGDMEGVESKPGEFLGIDVAQSNGMAVGELASVQELSFAFRRAASRLQEMTSRPWWEKKHAGVDLM